MKLTYGQRVETSMGPGVVIGFETFNAKGWPNPLVTEDPGNDGRVVVRLDDAQRWKPTPSTPYPYFFRHDIEEIA